MRLIAGKYRSRNIKAVPSEQTRPTTDRVREAWASTILSLFPTSGLEGKSVLDAFAGSGALGLELLSRGAEKCLFIDKDRKAFDTIRDNIRTLGIERSVAQVSKTDVFSESGFKTIAEHSPYDIIILDPPYAYESQSVVDFLKHLAQEGLLSDGCVISYEHAKPHKSEMGTSMFDSDEKFLEFELVKSKKYGTIYIDFYYFNATAVESEE